MPKKRSEKIHIRLQYYDICDIFTQLSKQKYCFDEDDLQPLYFSKYTLKPTK